jgi:type I restriction enzyme, R subunit
MISESEWLTRKKRIDGRLKVLGWRIVRHSEGISLGSLDKVAVEELPTASGPADYASALPQDERRTRCPSAEGQ